MLSPYKKFADEEAPPTIAHTNIIAISSPKRVPLFSKFLCFSLKTTALIIGYFYCIIYGLALPIVALIFQSIMSHTENDDEHALLNIFLGITIAICSLHLILNFLLLIGIYKKKTAILTTYMVIKGTLLCLTFFGVIKILARGTIPMRHVVETLIMSVIGVFAVLYIHSYRTQLYNEREVADEAKVNNAIEVHQSSLPPPPPYSES